MQRDTYSFPLGWGPKFKVRSLVGAPVRPGGKDGCVVSTLDSGREQAQPRVLDTPVYLESLHHHVFRGSSAKRHSRDKDT